MNQIPAYRQAGKRQSLNAKRQNLNPCQSLAYKLIFLMFFDG